MALAHDLTKLQKQWEWESLSQLSFPILKWPLPGKAEDTGVAVASTSAHWSGASIIQGVVVGH